MAIFGKKKDDDDKAKRPDFSDVRSGGGTTATPGTQGASSGAGSAREYVVKSGDSLSRIAQREYGDGSKWRAIYEANRDSIKNPDLIHPGQRLTIPPAS